MKTLIQDFIESITLKDSKDHILLIPTISKAEIEQLLEKEKEVMCGIYDDAISEFDPTYTGREKYGEQYYNETFNSKEK